MIFKINLVSLTDEEFNERFVHLDGIQSTSARLAVILNYHYNAKHDLTAVQLRI